MTEINTEQFPKCTYGNSTTNILGNDTFQIPLNGSEGLIQLPFDYAWPVSTFFFFPLMTDGQINTF